MDLLTQSHEHLTEFRQWQSMRESSDRRKYHFLTALMYDSLQKFVSKSLQWVAYSIADSSAVEPVLDAVIEEYSTLKHLLVDESCAEILQLCSRGCEGCLMNWANQEGHKGPGGCLSETSHDQTPHRMDLRSKVIDVNAPISTVKIDDLSSDLDRRLSILKDIKDNLESRSKKRRACELET